MSNIGSYEERLKNFRWSLAEKELGYKDGEVINIAWYCSDRICLNGNSEKIALYYGLTLQKKHKPDEALQAL